MREALVGIFQEEEWECLWTLPTSGKPFCREDKTQCVLEEPIPVTSIRGGDLSLLHLGGGLLHLLHHLLDGGLSLDRLSSLGRCWLLENSLLDLDGLGGTGLLLNGQHLRLVGGNHGVAVLLGAVGRVHWGGMVALDAPVVNMGNSSMVDHRSVVDDRGMVDHGSSVVDNRGSVHNRSSMVDNRGSVNHRGGMGDNGGSMGNRVSNDTVGKAMSNNTVGDTMSDDAMGNTVSDNTVSNSVANNTVGKTMSDHTSVTSSMEGVGVLSNSSNVSSEGLGLRVVSDLSLEGLGDGHMGSLSSSNSDMCNRVSSMSDKAVSSNQAVSGEDLGSGGGGSHQGGDAEESLKDHTFRNCLSTVTICHSPSTFMLVGCW